VFSPLADHVLCAGENPVVITLADASAQLMPTTDSFSWRAVCWNESGPQAVALLAELKHERVYLVDVVAAEMHALYEPTEGLLDFSEAAISNDGRFVSFWETECLRSASLFSCEPGQSEARLKVVEVSSGRSVTVASGGDGPGPISFSDDGTQIAYLFVGATGALHVRAFR